MLLLAAICLALVALLAYREWGAARERAAWERERADRRQVRAEESQAAAEERRELYQRIQAPDVAVHEAKLEARRERPYVRREPVGADNDAAFAARSAARQAERNGEGISE